ncbi:hypothetical protein LWI28_011839 [Acer negundo]|uniref:Uncharacterized protein n=1 Tax=Acer negundo TaxID=4023 RepID=A0AAD5JIL6_ACENE|nr:hypothetical protein LWI28_011839 [Acer negundo]KAK4853079.1 hypothetical protein QYF36_003416 [Acer negundo]
MPKDRRDRSVSFDRYRASPYPCSSSHNQRSCAKISSETEENLKEWEEARCPVCMEHPHNAVLLVCSSHEKGCRPYMCDTSYRHSNCLDQFRKSFAEASSTTSQPEETRLSSQPEETPLSFQIEETRLPPANSSSIVTSEATATNLQEERTEEVSSTPHSVTCEDKSLSKLVCPLCRGEIKDWIVVDSARRFMNAKPRSCACETCEFSGIYKDLRKHARIEHPLVRPSEADPERQHNWRRLERQRDIGDLLSTLQSSFGEESGDSSVLPIDDGGWLTVFFLIRVFRPGSGSSPRRSNCSFEAQRAPATANNSRQPALVSNRSLNLCDRFCTEFSICGTEGEDWNSTTWDGYLLHNLLDILIRVIKL